jgi:hypothetical protein
MTPGSASLFSPSADPVGVSPTSATLASVANPPFLGAGAQLGERAARRALRGQIARLERDLVEQRCSKWPRPSSDFVASPAGSRSAEPVAATLLAERGEATLLGFGELVAVRDRLIETLSAERRALASRTRAEEDWRRVREELMLDPSAYAGVRVRNADVGEGGCGEIRSRPIGGLLGMLMGWWRVVVSSGCP